MLGQATPWWHALTAATRQLVVQRPTIVPAGLEAVNLDEILQ